MLCRVGEVMGSRIIWMHLECVHLSYMYMVCTRVEPAIFEIRATPTLQNTVQYSMLEKKKKLRGKKPSPLFFFFACWFKVGGADHPPPPPPSGGVGPPPPGKTIMDRRLHSTEFFKTAWFSHGQRWTVEFPLVATLTIFVHSYNHEVSWSAIENFVVITYQHGSAPDMSLIDPHFYFCRVKSVAPYRQL